MAALVGVATLNDLMSDCYKRHRGDPVSTQMIEEFLLSKNGNPQIVDAFHRFVYGFPDPSPAPQLWLKDDAAHTGADVWSGAFWDSPDLWVRNQDDGGTAHQAPEHGQDNWFYARIRNKNTAGACKHFAVTFQAKPFAGTEFVYPADFLPCVAAKVEFDLAPGATRIVKAKWPRAQIPAAGTHTCLLASVIDPERPSGVGGSCLGAQQSRAEEPHDRRPQAQRLRDHPGRAPECSAPRPGAASPRNLARPGPGEL